MKENQTKVALNWVKDEVESTLEQAQMAVKAYAEDESDVTQIHFCANCMHQISGTMQMLEFRGAAILAEEMEALAEAIGEGAVEEQGQAYEVFLTAILKFKSYMIRYAEDKADLPIILMPIINEMRASRKHELIGPGSLITLHLDGVEAAKHPHPEQLSGDIQLEVKNLRANYQQGLLGFIRNNNVKENLSLMHKTTDQLWKLGSRVPYPNLWWVASVFLSHVVQANFQENVTVKNICGKLDRRIRDLVEQNNESEAADKLLKNLLFYVASLEESDQDVYEIQKAYDLKALLNSLGDYAAEAESLVGPDTDSVRTVLSAISDDLSEVKESLDIYIRTNSEANEPLQQMLPNLQKISDTMAMLNLEQPRVIIKQQISAINDLLDGRQTDRQQGLILIAESVIKLEDYIDRAMHLNSQQLASHDAGEDDTDSRQVIDARISLVEESRANLYKVKDRLSDYIENNFDIKHLSTVPELLNEVEGALQFSKLDALSAVITKTNRFIKGHLITEKIVLSEQEIVSMADAISSVDYYLEGLLSSGLHGLPIILQRAITSIDDLTSHYDDVTVDVPMLDNSVAVPVVEASEVFYEEDDGNLIDDEVKEIFIEEAEEVLAELVELLPKWQENQADKESLSTIRRNFHTLKGSGRMVGAMDVGELSWAVENMLNRLIDDNIQFSPAIVATTISVAEKLPAMVEAYANNQKTEYPSELAALADRISSGEVITDSVKETKPAEISLEDAVPEVPELEEIKLEGSESASVKETTPSPELELIDFGLEDDSETDANQELFEIFKQEAATHMTNLEMFANQRVQGITQSQISDNLLRSLHTLKGNAQIADNDALRNVIIPVESYFRELKSRELLANEADMNLIAHTKDLLKHIVEMPDDEAVIKTHEEAILEELSRVQTRLDQALQSNEDAGRDPEVLKDIFNVAADVLNDLRDRKLGQVEIDKRRDVVSHLMASVDRLHSMLQGADLAEIESITEAIGNALQKNLVSTEVDISLDEGISQAHAQLENQFDSLAANLSIPESPELIARLVSWSPKASESVESISLEEVGIEDISLEDLTPESSAQDEEVYEPDPEDVDSELLEIFGDEADEILNNDAALLEQWSQSPASLTHMPELQRNLHTLKGSARMTGFREIGDLAHELENLYTGLSDKLFVANKQTVELAQKVEDKLLLMVNARMSSSALPQANDLVSELARYIQQAKSGITPQIQPVVTDTSAQEAAAAKAAQEAAAAKAAQEAAAAKAAQEAAAAKAAQEAATAKAAQEAATAKAAQEAASDKAAQVAVDDKYANQVDSDLAQIFLGEAHQLLAGFDASIESWSNALNKTKHLKSAMRTLHTLKGGARLSTISTIANLAHKIEDTLSLLSGDHRLGQSRWVEVMRQGHDKLHKMVQEVTTGIMPAEAEDLLSEFDEHNKVIQSHIQQLKQKDSVVTDEQAEVNIVSLVERQKQKDSEAKTASSRDVIRVKSEVLDNLVNLAGESSILRARIEQQLGDLTFNLNEVSSTTDRLRAQLRNLEIETEAQVLYRREISGVDFDEFDPLEMDRYTRQQELTRSLLEAASDLVSLQETLQTRVGDAEASLLQQSRINTELQDRLMRTRMVPFDNIDGRLRRMVRQISSEVGKQVKFEIQSEGEMDRTVIERMVAPLEHILRNAIDHGIENSEERKKAGKPAAGQINLSLNRRGNEVFIQVTDDGAGIRRQKVKARAVAQGMIDESYEPTDRELFRLILQAGFSTAEEVTQISGRGVGMDVVHSEILQLGGSLNITSEQGEGTTLTVRLPFTLSSNQSLMVKVKGENYAIPLSNITTVARISADNLKAIYENKDARFNHLDIAYELRYLGQILDRNSQVVAPTDDNIPVLIIQGEGQPIAVHVDEILGSREIVVKSVGRQLSIVPGIAGASILGDGSVVLILDMQTLVDRFHEWDFSHAAKIVEEVTVEEHIPTIMVVDDSITVRKVTERLLRRNQYKVLTAKDGVDAATQLNDVVPDLMLLDIEMPRMDGFELATIIRRESRLKHLPIIMITSRTGEKHRQRAEEIGVNDYLGKPYNEDKLLETIQRILDEQED